MNYIGVMLALLTAFVLIYAAFTILKEHTVKNKTGLPPFCPRYRRRLMELIPVNVLKGNAFEKYVLSGFDDYYFVFHEWRSDKCHNGRYPLSNSNPDLLFEYKHRNKSILFAVECKWRAGFWDNAIHWANSNQIVNYYAYQGKQQIKVFVVIGIGGTPEQPDQLYVVPLNKIQKHMVYLPASFLKPFAKRTQSEFFLDTEAMTLT